MVSARQFYKSADSFSILIIIFVIITSFGHSQIKISSQMEQYSFTREIRLAPGEYYAVWYDCKRKEFVEEEPDRCYRGLGKEAQLQILRAPMWLREELADRLVDLYYDDIDVGEDAAPVFYDVNDDGLDDLIIGNAEGCLKCFLAPYFKEDAELFKHVRVASGAVPCFFDIDKDGEVELIVGDAAGDLSCWDGKVWKKPTQFGALPFSGRVHPIVVSGKDLYVGDASSRVWRFIQGTRFAIVKMQSGDNGSFATLILASGKNLQLQGSKQGKIFATITGSISKELIENLNRIKVSGNSIPIFHDMNHDNIPDLVIGSADGTISVFVNHGSKSAPWFTTYSPDYKRKFDVDVGYLSSPRIADLNSDGIPDMVSGAKDGVVRFFPGPDFKEQSDLLKAFRFEGVIVPAPGDFNGDGKVDIAIGFKDGSVRFFMGPAFVEDKKFSNNIKVTSYAAPYASDFDHDGKLDLLVGSGNGKIHLFRGTDKGFIETKDFFGELEIGECLSPAVFDVNEDGILDLVIGNRAGEIKVFLAPDWTEFEQGLGAYKTEGFATVSFGDLTGDEQPELVIGALDGTFIYLEKEKGGWVEKQSWKFEPGMGIEKVEDYFLRCHPESELLRGMIDNRSLNAFMKVMSDADDKYFDEIGFVISATPTEILRTMAYLDNADLLIENARCIYDIADKVKYASIVEKEDYTTLKYVGDEGVQTELPRDIYYWWVVHPRLYYEIPLRVNASYWEHDSAYHGVTYDEWTRKKADLKEFEKGPKCQFWRTYFIKDKKYGKTLLEAATPAKTIKEAVYLIGDWITQSLPESWFTYGRKSADLQPNVIYQKNYGSCGEAAILGTAFLRTMLIPSTCAGCSGEDHVWNEFWLEDEWCILDPTALPSQITYPWACCERVEHKGTQVLTITRHRGDDYIDATTTTVVQPSGCNYTPKGKGYTEVGSITIQVVDAEAEPVEGAAIIVRSDCRQYWRVSIWGYTDSEGICYFELGRPHRKCMLDIITQQGITGISSLPVVENQEYYLKVVVPGRFKQHATTSQKTGPKPKIEKPENALTVTTKIIQEEQRPRHLSTAQHEPKDTTDFIKETGYIGTLWYPHYNQFKRGIAFCNLNQKEFESFKKTEILPTTIRVVDTTVAYSFDQESGEVYLYYNTNRYTHVRFTATFTAQLPKQNPNIELTKVTKQAKAGEKIRFAGHALDNLYVAALKMSINGGRNWTDITDALDRKTKTFTYVWNTGQGGPLAPGKYPVVFKVVDGSGNYQQTDTIEVILENTREFSNQVIFQDDPDSPLPVASWILGPFELAEQERFLGITSFSDESEFDMDMFLFHDKNGNRKLDGMEEEKSKSGTPTAIEQIILNEPPKGVYWVYCQGWQVKPRKDEVSKSKELGEFPPGRFLALDYEQYEKKTAYAYLDISLSFDYKLTSIVDIGPVGEAPVDAVVVKGKFKPSNIDPATVRISVDGKDMTKQAIIDEKGFELKLLDAELDYEYTVNIEAQTCYGDVDHAEWQFKTALLPVSIEKKLVEDKRILEIIVQARKDFNLKRAGARFWNIKKEEEKSKWFNLKLSNNGKSGLAELSVDGQIRGSYTLEVEYEIKGGKVESKKVSFTLGKEYAEPKDIAVYPQDESKVYDFQPVLTAYVIGEYKDKTKSIKLIFDDVDITDKCEVYGTNIKYFPQEDLDRGEHILECVVTLKNKKTLTKKSTFFIKVMGED